MTLATRLLATFAHLPAARTHRVRIERDLRVPMPDGTILLADRLVPEGLDRPPVVLMRSPYGRRGFWALIGRVVAERGYQVVIQSCRGTFGSGGSFEPLTHERSDGLATFEWLRAQPWFGGSVGMMGPSYLGYVQWALAVDPPPELKAIAPLITGSEFGTMTYPGGGLDLETLLVWLQQLEYQEGSPRRSLGAQLFGGHELDAAFAHLPLAEAEELAFGRRIGFYHELLEGPPVNDGEPDPRDFSARVGDVTVPATLVGGWYDLFLPRLLADYQALASAGRTARLTVGPWRHVSPGIAFTGLRETLDWLDEHVRGIPPTRRRAPVRVFVMGRRRWRGLESWPPPSTPVRLHLGAGRRLEVPAPVGAQAADSYRYDPSDPTPAVGGVRLSMAAGRVDNRRLESRPDVLTYTTRVLEGDVEVIGPVSAELHVRSSLGHTDFFVRLCDVQRDGRSFNVCDGSIRLKPERPAPGADDIRCVRLDVWPTAYLFRRGHRMRVQVSSGAHPRIARNLGTGERLATATVGHAVDQEVFHDPRHPSAITLPVTAGARWLTPREHSIAVPRDAPTFR